MRIHWYSVGGVILGGIIMFSLLYFPRTAQFFNDIKQSIAPDSVSVLSFGDVMFDRGVRSLMNRGKNPFEFVMTQNSWFSEYDEVIANLEGPIVEMNRADCQQKIYNFQFASTTPLLLQRAGITMVNILNNHMYDCLSRGVRSTKEYLRFYGMPFMGGDSVEGSVSTTTIHNKKVAFVGMDETISSYQLQSFYSLIQTLKQQYDYVFVHIHWGTEYSPTATKTQQDIAHKLVNAGADAVFGHHPHVIEPFEVYKGKVIFYSLGNFVFDQTTKETNEGIGAGVKITPDAYTVSVYPYNIVRSQPKFLEGKDKEDFCNTYLSSVTRKGCTFEIKQDTL